MNHYPRPLTFVDFICCAIVVVLMLPIVALFCDSMYGKDEVHAAVVTELVAQSDGYYAVVHYGQDGKRVVEVSEDVYSRLHLREEVGLVLRYGLLSRHTVVASRIIP
jgi:hypothetical protein